MPRCDECQRFDSDQDAAVALARSWDTDWGVAGDPASEDAPGDWWVRLPASSRRDPFLSESAAVQAWIDGTPVPCLSCGEPLDRPDGAWRHQTPTRWCTYTQPAIAWLTDAEALDQIGGLLVAPERSGADFLDVINGLVIRTGRPAGMAAHKGWLDAVDQPRGLAGDTLAHEEEVADSLDDENDPSQPSDLAIECCQIEQAVDPPRRRSGRPSQPGAPVSSSPPAAAITRSRGPLGARQRLLFGPVDA